MWVGRGEVETGRPGGLGCDAVGQTHGPLLAVKVTSAQQPGLKCHLNLYRGWCSETELGQVEHRLLVIGPDQTYELIENLSDPERGEDGFLLALDELLHPAGGRLILEERQDRVGIENDHRRRSRAASSILD